MSPMVASRYRGAAGSWDTRALAAEAAGLVARLDAIHAGDVVAAVFDRRRLAVLVAACVASSRRVIFPHGFTGSVVHALAAMRPSGLVVHDRDDGTGLDMRGVDAVSQASDGSASFELSRVLVDHRISASLVFMTSGTTGEPRAIVKRPAELLAEATTLVEELGITPGTSLALGVPSTHLYGFLFGVVLPSVIPLDVFIPLVRTAADLEGMRVDRLVGAPPTLRAFAYGAGATCLGAQAGTAVISSGSALPDDVRTRLRAAGARTVVEIFGSTETGGVGIRRDDESAFVPMRGVSVAVGADERLAVRSVFLDPTCVDGTFVLGDRVALDARGAFTFLGRDADLVKIGARRVSVGHVESAIAAMPGVLDVVVRPRASSAGRGSRLAALAVGDDTLDPAVLARALRATFDPEFVPRPILRVPSLPRAGAGKITAAAFDRLFASATRATRAAIVLRALPTGALEVHIGAHSPRFDGHFVGAPILPGVSLLADVVLPAIHARHADLGQPTRVTRIKFTRPVRPGDILVGTFDRTGLDVVRFELAGDDGGKVASGILHFASRPPRATGPSLAGETTEAAPAARAREGVA